MRLDLTQQEWEEWRLHPVTKAYLKYLRDNRDRLKDLWADGVFTNASIEASAQKNVEAIAKCQTLTDLAELDYEAIASFYQTEE